MTILYDKPEQLLDEAKRLIVHLQLTAKHILSEDDALDIIASMFGWGSWSDMHYAAQKHANGHERWDRMTWREKAAHVISQAPGSASLLRKKNVSIDNLNNTQLHAAQVWLVATFMPPLEPIEPQKERKRWFPWVEVGKKASYKDVSSVRAFEGIKLLCDDTQDISEHLRNRFLPSMSDPDCIVLCEEAVAIDFARCFAARGYDIRLLSNGFSLPDSFSYTKASWFPDQTAREDDPYSLYAYVKNYVAHMDPHMLPQLSLALAYVAIDRFITSRLGVHSSMFLSPPTIMECEDIARSAGDPALKAHAQEVLRFFHTAPPSDDDTHRSPLSKSSEERWHYAAYAIKQLLEKMSSRLNTSTNNAIPIHEFNRPDRKTLYLCATDKSESDLIHTKVMLNMLFRRLSELPPCMKSHPWLILSPGHHQFVSTRSKGLQFHPRVYKNAKLGVLVCSERELTGVKVDTEVRLSPEGENIFDNRPAFLNKLISDTKVPKQ